MTTLGHNSSVITSLGHHSDVMTTLGHQSSAMTTKEQNVSTSAGPDNMTNITEVVLTLQEMNDAELLRLIPTIVFLGVISVTGMFGNGLVLHIYRTRYRLSNSQCFILCLSAIDMFCCCVVIPFEISTIVNQYTFDYLWLCKLSRLFNTLGTLSSSFLLLFIAIDRYRKVCKPFRVQISAKVAKFLCSLAVMLGLLFSWPAVLVYGKKTFEIPNSELIGTECSTDDRLVETIYPFINISMYAVLFLGGIVSICFLYCLIGREVQRHVNRMPKEYSHSKNSIPMLSSSMDGRGSKVEGEIDINAITRYEKAKSKNKENKSRHKRYTRKQKSASDMSWSEKLDETNDEIEMKERKTEEKEEEKDNEKETIGMKGEGHYTGQCESPLSLKDSEAIDTDMCKKEIPDKDTQTELKVEKVNGLCDTKTELNHDPVDTNIPIDLVKTPNKETDNVPLATIDSSPLSSTGSVNKIRKSLSGRLHSLTSQVSHVLARMTSITSRNSEASTATVVKTQYLKQARARKTAFLMFMISLVFVLSYLPHLLLMLIRVVKDDFIPNMTDTERAVYKFFLRSYFMNCAINPVIYAACAGRFRKECKAFFCELCGRAKSEDMT